MKTPVEVTPEILIAYIEGYLDVSLRREVTEQLNNDEFVRAQYEGLLILKEERKNEELETSWEEWSTKGSTSDVLKNESFRGRKMLWLAASIAILIVSIYFIIDTTKETKFADLRDSSFSRVEQVRSSTENWIIAYDKGEFNTVVSILEDAPNLSLQESFYLGMAHYRLKEYELAIDRLTEASKSPILKSDSHFALALIYADLNKKEEALQQLEMSSHADKDILRKILEQE
jgi:tetratricopeptide (TPR) repeat protein